MNIKNIKKYIGVGIATIGLTGAGIFLNWVYSNNYTYIFLLYGLVSSVIICIKLYIWYLKRNNIVISNITINNTSYIIEYGIIGSLLCYFILTILNLIYPDLGLTIFPSKINSSIYNNILYKYITIAPWWLFYLVLGKIFSLISNYFNNNWYIAKISYFFIFLSNGFIKVVITTFVLFIVLYLYNLIY